MFGQPEMMKAKASADVWMIPSPHALAGNHRYRLHQRRRFGGIPLLSGEHGEQFLVMRKVRHDEVGTSR
jgi:hypothetical protein